MVAIKRVPSRSFEEMDLFLTYSYCLLKSNDVIRHDDIIIISTETIRITGKYQCVCCVCVVCVCCGCVCVCVVCVCVCVCAFVFHLHCKRPGLS